jgi:sugar lactone lactonase YvrE
VSTTTPVRIAADTGDTLGESPWWDAAAGCLWWIDVRAPALRRLDPATGAVDRWPMPSPVGAVVGRRSGGVVVALADGIHAFDPGTGTLAALAAVDLPGEAMRLNDAKADATGALWFGSMRDFGADDAGGLWRLSPGATPERLRAGVRTPNAIAFAADGSLFFCDTPLGTIDRAAPDGALPDGGGLAWSAFAAADVAPGAPDGATVDAEGFLWNARWGGGALARIAPDGTLDRLVPLPVSNPTSCAFGGAGLRTLYVTTARQGLTPARRAAEPLAGALLALDVGIAGLPEPAFAG